MNRTKIYLLFLFFIVNSLYVVGQETITGKVTDEFNEPLPGVNVLIKNALRGTITDLDGTYTIQANLTDTLVFSMVGMETIIIPVQDKEEINIVLEQALKELNEVVVVGYGTTKSKDLTAPITTINAREIAGQVTPNPAQALQGKVAGVTVTNSGEPGSQPDIKIRGVGTIFGGGTGPLYVVDGVIVDDISFLNNNDIESMSILKDASAGAIYGVRAANGVILITTKSGKPGETFVSFQTYTGFQMTTNLLPMAGKDEYIELLNQKTGLTGAGDFFDTDDFEESTNWYDQLLRTALITNHELSLSGGSERYTYNYGISYLYQDGILDTRRDINNNNFNRLNFRAKNDFSFTDDIDLGYTVIFSKNNTVPAYNYSLFQAFVAPPVFTPGSEDNWTNPLLYGFSGPFANPLASLYYYNNEIDLYTIIPTTYFSFDFLENFNFRTDVSANLKYSREGNFTSEYYVSGLQNNTTSSLNKTNTLRRDFLWDNVLGYENNFGRNHSFKIIAGSSLQQYFNTFLSGTAYNVPDLSEATRYISLGNDDDRTSNDGGEKYNVVSFFSRLNYSFASKYLLTATFRADGSSKYNDQWGFFPAIGGGWIISKENFINDVEFVDFLKLRASWGRLGNNNVPPNSEIIVGKPGPGTTGIFGGNRPVPGITFQTVYNNFLNWEEVEEFDIGLEFYTLGNRLNIEIDYYNRETRNAVFPAPIPGVSGTGELLGNNGTVLNEGIETILGWGDENETGDFAYNVSANFSYNRNEVLEINNESGIIYGPTINGAFITKTIEGEPIGSYFGYKAVGVFQSNSDINGYQSANGEILQPDALPGDLKFENTNNDDAINADDRVFLGNPIPNYTFGISGAINLGYWDFSLNLQGVAGNELFNAKRADRNIFPDANYSKDFYDNHWTGQGSTNEYPSAALDRRNILPNSFFVEPGWYLRIRNIQVGYTLPESIINTLNRSSFRIYATIQNPYTLYAYNGFTPEIGGNPISRGIDYSTYPLSATYILGLNLNF